MAFYESDEIGPYKLIHPIKNGRFGEVWLAKHNEIGGQPLALKIPVSRLIKIQDVQNEANVWKQASNHKNVLPIIEANLYPTKHGEHLVIVTPYIPGGSLEDYLDTHKLQDKTIPLKNSVHIMNGILSGLNHLQQKNIAHRDLKPANILLEGLEPLITDFGFAKILGESSKSSNIFGSWLYMSPEALDGHRSSETDFWSASVIFYQLLTGKMPFSSVADIIRPHVTPMPLPLSIPSSVQSVLVKALEKDLTNRCRNAQVMQQALIDIIKPDFLLINSAELVIDELNPVTDGQHSGQEYLFQDKIIKPATQEFIETAKKPLSLDELIKQHHVYDDLRKIAQRYLRSEIPDMLEPDELINEMYLRLSKARTTWQYENEFFAFSSVVMRRILIDQARSPRRKFPMLSLEGIHFGVWERDFTWVQSWDLYEALAKLRKTDPVMGSIITLKYYAGYTNEDISSALGIHKSTVKRKFIIAKKWLYEYLKPTEKIFNHEEND